MKWYTSILSFLTGFLNLTPGSEEHDIHEELQTAFGKHTSLAEYKAAVKAELRTEIETELNAAHKAEMEAIQSGLAETERNVEALQTLTNQQADEIAALKKQPAATHTGGKKEEEAPAPVSKFGHGPGYDKVRSQLRQGHKKLPFGDE